MSGSPRSEELPLDALRAQYQRLLQRLEANEREFRRLGRAVWNVQEDERRRLARELHDGLGQNLTALKHRLAQLLADLPAEAAPLRERLGAAVDLCGDALEDTRQLSRLLRPPILDDLGLAAALQWLARSIDASGPMRVVTELEPLPPLDGELQTLLFRVAQEALNNASKHARAQSVLLRLVARGGELQLQVIDDGIGCDVEQALRAGGSGLPGMRERLRLYGGRLELRSAAGQGTRLRAVVPLPAGDAVA
ncbi:sensor histidine kinase [Lysobacter sp. M2-1]|uniref:sensor histidine kinase n=1 Tax=Lysobacter sp. M2-1 TaxID=2916839 RepID=UPI001F569994|nr:sensor histidine kinase [Lysobacter sp. M2-1]